MRVIKRSDVDARPTDAVFAQSAGWLLVPVGVGILIIVGVVVQRVGWPKGLPWLFSIWIGLAGLLLAFVFGRNWRAARRDSNWLLRVGRDGRVAVKFRSYLNWRFADDEPQVFAFSPVEILSARRAGGVRRTQDDARYSSVRTLESQTFLELLLKPPVDPGLAAALAAERNRPGVGGRVRSRALHEPVQLLDGNVLRLVWRDARNTVTPNVNAALDALRPWVRVDDAASANQDFTLAALSSLPPDALEQRLTVLARTDPMTAATTVAALHGESLGDAKAYVDDLRRRQG